MIKEPTNNERRLLAGGDRLLVQMHCQVLGREAAAKMPGAARIEIWQTETACSEPQITVMEFDRTGAALRASIFTNLQAAQRWLSTR